RQPRRRRCDAACLLLVFGTQKGRGDAVRMLPPRLQQLGGPVRQSFASRARSSIHLRRLAMLVGAATLSLGLAAPAAAQWQPNETRASPQTDLIDYEFSQSRGMFVWNDCCGKLWIGKVDRATGKFEPSDGKFMLVDPDSMTFDDASKTKNGPEWVSTSIGDVIVYTRYSGRHIDANARIGYAFPMLPSSSCNYISADAYWCATNLGPSVARK